MKKLFACAIALSVLAMGAFAAQQGAIASSIGSAISYTDANNTARTIPIRVLDNARQGMLLFGRKEAGYSVIVLRQQGAWYAYAPGDADLDLFALEGFQEPSVDDARSPGRIAVEPQQKMLGTQESQLSINVSVSSVTASNPPAKETLLLKGTTVDPRYADGQTIYLMSPDYSGGVQLGVRGDYEFETSDPLIGKYASLSVKSRRITLAYWALGLGDYLGSSYLAQIANSLPAFSAAMYSDLASYNASSNLRASILALLRLELDWQSRSRNSQTQYSWDFPSYSLMATASSDECEYCDAFFILLNKAGLLAAPDDPLTANLASIDASVGASIAKAAKDYLKGVEGIDTASLPSSAQAIYDEYVSVRSSLPAVYDPSAPLDSLRLPYDASVYAWNCGGYGTSMELIIPSGAGKSFAGMDPLLFLPPGPNLLTSENISNYADIAALESPVSDPQAAPTNQTITLAFAKPVSLRSLALWSSLGANCTVTARLNGTEVLLKNTAVAYYVDATTAAGTHSLAASSSTSSRLGIGIIDFGGPVSVDKIIIAIADGPALNLRAYSGQATPNGSWSYDPKNASNIIVNGAITNASPELFSSTGGNDLSYFLQVGGISAPKSGSNRSTVFAPIRYVHGGLETPLGYNLKIINNKVWRDLYASSKSSFSLTELDLGQGIAVDQGYRYSGSSSLQRSLAVPKRGSPPSPATMYPYAYGVEVPSQAGVVTDKNSPFYVEKLAGVDSAGMLMSVLKMLGLHTRTDPVVQQRYDQRTKFDSYQSVQAGSAWPYSPSSYFADQIWFLQNSYALVDPSEIRVGDILVGYEGSELCVGIIADQDSQASDPMSRWYVLTISRATKRAIYARWNDMSLYPKNYHARRLVVDSSAATDAAPLANTKSYLSLGTALSYDLERPDPDGFKQWIPNTGELAYLGKIKLKTADGQDLSSLLEGSSWELASVKDYGYDAAKADGNVHNNAGTIFHLVALETPTNEDGIAVTPKDGFYPAVNGGNVADLFTLTKSGDGSYSTGQGKLVPNSQFLGEGWTLVVKNSCLTLVDGGTNTVYQYFALQAENPVPGDDLQIEFTIHSSMGDLPTDIAKAPRLAVYDKKMLWRANLYVDKDSPVDWNNLHPWIRSINQPNEWNHGQGGGREGLGGQSQLQQFTTIGPGDAVGRYLPYDYPRGKDGTDALGTATDSPFAFNRKMMQLKEWQNTKYRENGELRNVTSQSNDIWNKTVAPANLWEGYFNSQSVLNSAILNAFSSSSNLALPQVGLFYYLYDYFRDSSHLDKRLRDDLQIKTQDGANVSLGGYLRYNQNGNDFSPRHIGVDCIGFAQRAASYADNPYFWPDFADDTLVDIGDGSTKRSYPSGKDAQGNCYSISVANRNNNAGLKFLVPGDVVTYDTPGHPNSHVAIVQNISLEPDGSALPGDVSLIEAYFQGESSWVGFDRTLQSWQNPGQTWFADRLTLKDLNQ